MPFQHPWACPSHYRLPIVFVGGFSDTGLMFTINISIAERVVGCTAQRIVIIHLGFVPTLGLRIQFPSSIRTEQRGTGSIGTGSMTA